MTYNLFIYNSSNISAQSSSSIALCARLTQRPKEGRLLPLLLARRSLELRPPNGFLPGQRERLLRTRSPAGSAVHNAHYVHCE